MANAEDLRTGPFERQHVELAATDQAELPQAGESGRQHFHARDVTRELGEDQAANLRRVVDSLPAEHAAALRLVHLEGLTLAEAGAQMGKSAEAVRKIYGRALARLAERLRGAGGTEA